VSLSPSLFSQERKYYRGIGGTTVFVERESLQGPGESAERKWVPRPIASASVYDVEGAGTSPRAIKRTPRRGRPRYSLSNVVSSFGGDSKRGAGGWALQDSRRL